MLLITSRNLRWLHLALQRDTGKAGGVLCVSVSVTSLCPVLSPRLRSPTAREASLRRASSLRVQTRFFPVFSLRPEGCHTYARVVMSVSKQHRTVGKHSLAGSRSWRWACCENPHLAKSTTVLSMKHISNCCLRTSTWVYACHQLAHGRTRVLLPHAENMRH